MFHFSAKSNQPAATCYAQQIYIEIYFKMVIIICIYNGLHSTTTIYEDAYLANDLNDVDVVVDNQ